MKRIFTFLSILVLAALACSLLGVAVPLASTEAAAPISASATPPLRTQSAAFDVIPDATYGVISGVKYITIPATICTHITATPIVVGDYLVYPAHNQGHGCQPRDPYAETLFGYNLNDGLLYELADGASGEGTLLYQPQEDRVLWTTTFGGAARLLDASSFTTTVTIGASQIGEMVNSDSSGAYLNGLFYFGTINTPENSCQNPIKMNCGAVFAVNWQGNVVHRINTQSIHNGDNGFRSWIGAGVVTDGEAIYVGGSPQHYGTDESVYRYGCSTVKLSPDLHILASADPGDRGCHRLGHGNADEDAVAGEPVLGMGEDVWVRHIRPTDSRLMTPIILYNRNLEEQCRVEVYTGPYPWPLGFYGALTVDKDGNAYAPYNLPVSIGSSKAVLLKIARDCSYQTLTQIAGVTSNASPTLADDQYVLFAVNGRLLIYATDGSFVREYALASNAEVAASPVIHNGVIYVLAADGTLNVIENSGLQGYGTAIWPRYRHDNHGSGALTGAGVANFTVFLPLTTALPWQLR